MAAAAFIETAPDKERLYFLKETLHFGKKGHCFRSLQKAMVRSHPQEQRERDGFLDYREAGLGVNLRGEGLIPAGLQQGQLKHRHPDGAAE